MHNVPLLVSITIRIVFVVVAAVVVIVTVQIYRDDGLLSIFVLANCLFCEESQFSGLFVYFDDMWLTE